MSALIPRALMPSLLVLGLAVVVSPALAQTGQVKGKVVDVKNQPVEKAQVTIEATDGMGRKFNVTRDAAGNAVEGDPQQIANVTDVWTFSRNTRSRDPNWLLVATADQA